MEINGVKLGTLQVPILVFADDMALLAENEQDLQSVLNCVYSWCNKSRMTVNSDTTKVIHLDTKGNKLQNLFLLLIIVK